VTISTPGVEGDSDRLVMESDRVDMSAITMVATVEAEVAMAWVAAVLVALLCLMLLVTMLGVMVGGTLRCLHLTSVFLNLTGTGLVAEVERGGGDVGDAGDILSLDRSGRRV
jgi:hypothetical protein